MHISTKDIGLHLYPFQFSSLKAGALTSLDHHLDKCRTKVWSRDFSLRCLIDHLPKYIFTEYYRHLKGLVLWHSTLSSHLYLWLHFQIQLPGKARGCPAPLCRNVADLKEAPGFCECEPVDGRSVSRSNSTFQIKTLIFKENKSLSFLL